MLYPFLPSLSELFCALISCLSLQKILLAMDAAGAVVLAAVMGLGYFAFKAILGLVADREL